MLKKLLKDDLFKHSAFMFMATSIVNVFNLIYHLFMVRALSPVDYGILNSLIAMLMFMSQPLGTLNTVVAKFVSEFSAHNRIDKIRQFLINLGKRVSIIGCLVFIVILFGSGKISAFLQLSSWQPVALLSFILFFSILTPLIAGSLQGLEEFFYLGISSVMSGGIKLVLAIILVIAGFGVYGALYGFLFSTIFLLFFPLFLSIRVLRKRGLRNYSNDIAIEYKKIYRYFIPVAISTFCIIALTNIDIILVKHYFEPIKAGFYSIAQMVGKIILFLPGAISIVMFPKASGSYARGKSAIHILNKSILYVSILCGLGIAVSLLFPEYIIKVLTGKIYPECIPLVKLFALAMGIYALVIILIYYHLSIHSLKFNFFLLIFVGFQTLLISLFHNSLEQVLYILIAIASILFIIGISIAKVRKI